MVKLHDIAAVYHLDEAAFLISVDPAGSCPVKPFIFVIRIFLEEHIHIKRLVCLSFHGFRTGRRKTGFMIMRILLIQLHGVLRLSRLPARVQLDLHFVIFCQFLSEIVFIGIVKDILVALYADPCVPTKEYVAHICFVFRQDVRRFDLFAVQNHLIRNRNILSPRIKLDPVPFIEYRHKFPILRYDIDFFDNIPVVPAGLFPSQEACALRSWQAGFQRFIGRHQRHVVPDVRHDRLKHGGHVLIRVVGDRVIRAILCADLDDPVFGFLPGFLRFRLCGRADCDRCTVYDLHIRIFASFIHDEPAKERRFTAARRAVRGVQSIAVAHDRLRDLRIGLMVVLRSAIVEFIGVADILLEILVSIIRANDGVDGEVGYIRASVCCRCAGNYIRPAAVRHVDHAVAFAVNSMLRLKPHVHAALRLYLAAVMIKADVCCDCIDDLRTVSADPLRRIDHFLRAGRTDLHRSPLREDSLTRADIHAEFLCLAAELLSRELPFVVPVRIFIRVDIRTLTGCIHVRIRIFIRAFIGCIRVRIIRTFTGCIHVRILRTFTGCIHVRILRIFRVIHIRCVTACFCISVSVCRSGRIAVLIFTSRSISFSLI